VVCRISSLTFLPRLPQTWGEDPRRKWRMRLKRCDLKNVPLSGLLPFLLVFPGFPWTSLRHIGNSDVILLPPPWIVLILHLDDQIESEVRTKRDWNNGGFTWSVPLSPTALQSSFRSFRSFHIFCSFHSFHSFPSFHTFHSFRTFVLLWNILLFPHSFFYRTIL